MKVGIIGKGQLGRMMAFAAEHLPCEVLFYEPELKRFSPTYRASASDCVEGERALSCFIEACDVITFETENVDNALARMVAAQKPFFPSVEVLEMASHRLLEKQAFSDLAIPVAPFCAVNSPETLEKAAQALGYPFVLKTATMGYDGKGQTVFKTPESLTAFEWTPGEYIAEGWVHFNREVSIIAARSTKGEIAVYPIGVNEHADGILRKTIIAPDLISEETQNKAREYVERFLTHYEYVGVLALELFETDQALLVNECAPRVHNSGHWTIEGAQTSQFEQHLRALTGMPLGETGLRWPYVVMHNLIGEIPRLQLSEQAVLHDYEKSSRKNRKVGHVTCFASQENELPNPLVK